MGSLSTYNHNLGRRHPGHCQQLYQKQKMEKSLIVAQESWLQEN